MCNRRLQWWRRCCGPRGGVFRGEIMAEQLKMGLRVE